MDSFPPMVPFFSAALPEVRATFAPRTLGANLMVQGRAAARRDTAGNDFFHCKCMIELVGREEEPWIRQPVVNPGVQSPWNG